MRKERSITFRVEAELLDAVEKAADKDGRTVGAYIRQVLNTHFQPQQEAACPTST